MKGDKHVIQIEATELNDARNIIYEGDLNKYFDEVSKCEWFTQEILILIDMYKEIQKLKENE